MAVNRRVRVHIDTLRLIGVDAHDPGAVAEALRSELGRLIAAEGVPGGWADGADVDRLTGPLPRSRSGPVLGRDAAAAVYAAGGGEATHGPGVGR